MENKQHYVCLICGYNMVGYYPDACPFCGASHAKFITAAECSNRFKVITTPVSDTISCLNSVPALGLEHAAYRVDTGTSVVWVDCPSTFDSTLDAADIITFTHHHFLGASHLYQDFFKSRLRIHQADSVFNLSRGYTFDQMFTDDHEINGIQAHHIDGHTPGFSCYLYGDTLFVCDYVFCGADRMKYNPFGPRNKTKEGGKKLMKIVKGRQISRVCGYNYILNFPDWLKAFDQLLAR